MKIVSGIVLFVMMGVFANAQDAKVIAELTASSERLVKNAPFSAEAVSESVQTLADGNRIVRNSSSKLYRNGEGRFRREMTSGSGGMLGSLYTLGQGVTLLDPVGGYRYMIDPNLKTTRQMVYSPKADIKIVTDVRTNVEVGKLSEELKVAVAAGANGGQTVVLSEKLKGELKAVAATAPVVAARAMTGTLESLPGFTMAYSMGQNSKWETRTEQLGMQNIEGVDAEGTRTITTIPAGAIGNERSIEIIYEKWHSRDLNLVVMSKHSDPRFGEQTYRLTNIVRSEPDPSLFTPPHGYKLITEPSGFTHTYTTTRAVIAEKAAAGHAARAATPAPRSKP